MATQRLLQGFRDYLPKTMRLRQHLIRVVQGVFEKYGFEPLDTPALEYADLLMGKYGEDEKLIYHFEDHGERKVALRYDLTVPLARVIATHPEITMPFKRYQIAPVWRADSPQRGRYREFLQCDADTVGASSPLADAEMILVMADIMRAIGMSDYHIHLSHRGVFSALMRHFKVTEKDQTVVSRQIDKINKIGRAEIEKSLASVLEKSALSELMNIILGTENKKIEKLELLFEEDPEGLEALANLSEIIELLDTNRVKFKIDLSIVRGLEYYTGVVYETILDSNKELGSVCSGGRYDKLLGQLAGRDLPAVGTSLGLDRLMAVMDQDDSASDHLCMTVFPGLEKVTFELADQLRHDGLSIALAIGNPKLGKQFQYADEIGAKAMLILGDNEHSRGLMIVRNMQTGDQHEVELKPSDTLSKRISDLL